MTSSSSTLLKKLLVLFLLVAGLYFGRDFLMPIALAAIIAALFRPLCEWLEHRGFPRLLTPFVCIIILLAFGTGIGFLVGFQVNTLTEEAAMIKQRGIEYFGRAQQYVYDLVGMNKEEQVRLLKQQQSVLSGMIGTLAGSMLSVLTNGILVMVYIFLFLYYRAHLQEFVIRLANPSRKQEVANVVTQASQVAQQYLLGLAKMIACLWVLYGIGFSLVGVQNALFFAILCGLLEIIPFIGNITGTSITVLVTAVQGGSTGTLAGIVIVYGIVQFIQGWVLESVIVGPHVRINPLFTILALVLGELLWGIPGIVLAIPGLAVVKIICDHVEALKPYGFLFGEVRSRDHRPGWFQRLFRRQRDHEPG